MPFGAFVAVTDIVAASGSLHGGQGISLEQAITEQIKTAYRAKSIR
jgi:hypothetical protein